MEFLRRVPQWFRKSDTGVMNQVVEPGVVFRLEEIRLHLATAGGAGAGDFTVSLDSGAGADYDVVLISQDMAAVSDFVFRPVADQRVLFDEKDKLVLGWPNTNNVKYGLEVIWSQVRDVD
jgi:hypothetical protein